MNNSENSSIVDSDIPEKNPEPAVDAMVKVSISPDGLKASIYIQPPENGGSVPTYEAMRAELSNHNVSYNIDEQKLKDLDAAPEYNHVIVIARGIAPVDGLDGTASFRIKTEKKELKPREKENGSVDYRDLDNVENVTQGQVLCVITPPTEGSPGVSVQGKPLRQRKGRPVKSYLGSNTVMSEDGTAILSRINGQVDFTGNKINVAETYYVKGNVDISTGNISVQGNLVVTGTVMPGFTAEAVKDIDIKGTVENATIKSGGNINMQSGITGSEIHCDGDLKCRFLENCTALVKGNLMAGAIVKSDVICGKTIKVSGAIAKIVGGSYTAGQNIEAHIIGSEANFETRLELGFDYTLIKRQQELLTKTADLQNQIKNLEPLITLLRQYETNGRLTPEKRQALEKASYSYDVNKSLLNEANEGLDDIQKSVTSENLGRIICSEVLYAGTKVTTGQAVLNVKDTLRGSSLYYQEGKICIGTV
ncbi:MAG: DUF342 domain-containing protein [Oscillospiraceae bacterium]